MQASFNKDFASNNNIIILIYLTIKWFIDSTPFISYFVIFIVDFMLTDNKKVRFDTNEIDINETLV